MSARFHLPLVVLAAALAAACHHPGPEPPPGPGIVVSRTSLRISEGGGAATFDVTLRTRPSAPVDVEVRSDAPAEGLVLVPGQAVPAPAREITFTPEDWDVPRSVAIHAMDDHAVGGDVAYTITLRVLFSEDAEYASADAVAVRVTTVEDDVPRFVVSAHALVTAEGGPARSFTVRLATVPSTEPVYVDIASTDPSEGLLKLTDSWDGCFYASAALSLAFYASDWYRARSVDVCPQDDLDPDGDQTYAVTIRSSYYAPEYVALAPEVVTVTNADDETGFAVVAPSQPLVTSEVGTTASLGVRLNAAPLSDVLIPVTSGNPGEGLVASGSDGPAVTVTLVFTPGNWYTAQTVTVIGQDDAASPVFGDDVSYRVTVGPAASADPAFAGRVPQAADVLNLDDDAPFLVVVPLGAFVTREDGGTTAFEVSLGEPPRTDVILPVTSGDPVEGLVATGYYATPQPTVSLTFTALDWQTPRTIVVSGQRDGIADGDRTYSVQIGPATGDPKYAAMPPQSLTFTNLDVDVVMRTFASSDVPRTIPDLSTVASVLTVTNGPAALTKVTAFVTLTHTWDADLVLTLVAPSGRAVTLVSGRGGGGDDFTGTIFDDGATTSIGGGVPPFPGSYRPENPLSALAGENANGVWTLRIQDAASGDTGTLLSWGITVQ